VQRHLSSGMDCAMAGMATPVAAVATPVSPAALRNSRRFMVSSETAFSARAMRPRTVTRRYHERWIRGNPSAARRVAISAHRTARRTFSLSRGEQKGSFPQHCCRKRGAALPNRGELKAGSRPGSGPDHESVVVVLGDLPPKIALVAERQHRFQHFLEI